jgi:protein tyrosine/serine phosphatase
MKKTATKRSSAWTRMMRRWREGFVPLASRWQRVQAWIDLMVIDHGLLRALYPNRAPVGTGILRSSQPSPRQIADLARDGIRTIINLRGKGLGGPWHLEAEACRRHGIRLVDIRTSSRKLPDRATLLLLLDTIGQADRPLLFHCKSGADRAGMAAVAWRLSQGDAPDAAARDLSRRYLHFRSGPTGVLDLLAEAYARDIRTEPMTFRTWVESRYEPDRLNASFRTGRLGEILVDRLLNRE